MVSENMEGPLIKKRSRVTVNKPLSPDSANAVAATQVPTENIANASEICPEKIQDLPVVENSLEDSSSDHSTGTYNVNKSDALVQNDVETESGGVSDVESVEGPDFGLPEEVPVPAPRRNLKLKTKDAAIQLEEQFENEDQLPPQPIPRTRRQKQEEASEGRVKARIKKRNAADVIASVLKRESKKFPRVATVLEETEECEKGRDECDVGSPWDSPPPPQSLEKVYIQHKYGSSVRDWCDFYNKPSDNMEPPRNNCAVDTALEFHGVWSRLSVFSHGVVAGVACCHSLAVAAAVTATHSNVPDFVQFYHFLSLKVHFAIYVFTTICIVSCMDRLDVGQVSKEHVRAIGRSHGTLLVTLGYLLCLTLSLAAHRHTAAIESYPSDHSLLNAQGLQEWMCLVTTRDILLLVCWIFMSCSRPADFMQEELLNMSSRQSKPGFWH